MLEKLLKKISSYPITFESWILSVLGIIVVRIFLEQYSNNIPGHFVLIDAPTIIQYAASFIAILLLTMATVLYFTKKTLQEVVSLTLFAFMIIWTAPIFDIILSGGKGYNIHYIFLGARDLFFAFISEFWTTTSAGMTYGIRIEIALILIASLGMIYIFTRSAWKTALGTILIWASIFLVDCIPSFLGMFQSKPISSFVRDGIINSNIINNSSFSLDLGLSRLYDIGFDSLMSQVCVLIIIIAVGLICTFGYREKATILLRNARFDRILHYVLLVVVGVIFGGGKQFFLSWVNDLSLIITMVAFTSAWISAVCVNDIQDISIDQISNKNRPLPEGSFTVNEFHSLSKIFFIFALLAAYAASLYGLFFVILFSCVYYIYSTKPLLLKRHFISGSLVVGIASTSAILSGFFLAFPSHELLSFSPLIALVTILFFGFSSMIKDLKDYDGDLINNIKTLPVVIGFYKAKVLIALIVSVAMIGMSLYLGNNVILIASLITSVIVWIILLKKTYKERSFYVTYLIYLIFCSAVILFS